MLDVEAVAGRTFAAEEDNVAETNLAALLSYGLWQQRFGGNADVIGETLELDKHAFTVVGVLPPGFRGQSGTADAWVTMMSAPLLRYKRTLTTRTLLVSGHGRLKTRHAEQSQPKSMVTRTRQKYQDRKQRGRERECPTSHASGRQGRSCDQKVFLILLGLSGCAPYSCANTATCSRAGIARRGSLRCDSTRRRPVRLFAL